MYYLGCPRTREFAREVLDAFYAGARSSPRQAETDAKLLSRRLSAEWAEMESSHTHLRGWDQQTGQLRLRWRPEKVVVGKFLDEDTARKAAAIFLKSKHQPDAKLDDVLNGQ